MFRSHRVLMLVMSGLLLVGSAALGQDGGLDRPPELVKPAAQVIPEPKLDDSAAQDRERIDLEVERRQGIIDHPHTIAIIHAFVIETEPVLFTLPEEDPEFGPRFDMFTRVVAEVHKSYKSEMPKKVEFWVHGGVIEDPEERVFGLPYAIFNTADIRLEPGDEVLACLQNSWALPDGRLVLTLRGFSRGASFPNSQIDNDRAVGLSIRDYLTNHYALER